MGTVTAVEIGLLWLGITLASRTVPCFWAGSDVLGWTTDRVSCTAAGIAGVAIHVAPVVVTVLILASATVGVAASIRTVVRTRRRVQPVLARAREARTELRELVDELDPDRPPTVLEVDLDEPVCFVHGLLRPQVVISTGLVDELAPRQLRAVLAHELRHVHVRDPLKVVVARGLSAAAFPFPALRDVVEHILLRCELNADEAAAETAGRRTIADTLTQVLFHPRYAVDTAFGAPETARARVARLAGHGPPSLDVPPRRLIGSLASLVTVVGTAGAVFLALPPSPPAYATGDAPPPTDLGWAPTPGPPPADQGELDRRLHEACDPSYRMLADVPPPEGFGPPFPEDPLPLAVHDSRGQVSVAAFATGEHVFLCHVDRIDPDSWEVVGATGQVISASTDTPVTAILRYTSTPRDGVVTSVVGTAGPDVDEVTVSLVDGSAVQAALAGGYYVAWWPAATAPRSIVARAGGQQVGRAEPPDISGGS